MTMRRRLIHAVDWVVLVFGGLFSLASFAVQEVLAGLAYLVMFCLALYVVMFIHGKER